MTYYRNPQIKCREDNGHAILYDIRKRSLMQIHPELYRFWKSFPSYVEYLNAKGLDPESFQEVIEFFLEQGLLVCDEKHSQKTPLRETEKKGNSHLIKLNYPISVCLKVTNRCNYRCRHCIQNSGICNNGELSKEQIFSLIDEFDRNQLFVLDINGGECLTRPDIRDILQYCRNRFFDTVLSTNASLIDDEMACFLKSVPIKLAKVSLEAGNSVLQDEIRGEGSFERTTAGIRSLVKVGIPVTIQSCVSHANMYHLDELVQYSIKLGVKNINIFLMIPEGRGRDLEPLCLSGSEYKKLLEMLSELKRRYPDMNFVSDSPLYNVYYRERGNWDKDNCVCLAGQMGCVIKENGDVTPCPYFNEPIGNINDRFGGFAEIWRNSVFLEQLMNVDFLGKECRECEHRAICFGGCRAAAFYKNGTISSRDPYCFV